MIRIVAALLCFMALPAHAQQGEPTARQAMAGLMLEAMVPSSQASYGYSWDSVSIRVSRHMRWHLAGPDRGLDKTPPTPIRRNGWIEGGGEQVSVSAHGFETVKSLSFNLSRWPGISGNDADLIEALKAAGVTATPRPAPPSIDAVGTAAYDLATPGREPARLTRAVYCTPEGSRAVRQCSATYELVLKP